MHQQFGFILSLKLWEISCKPLKINLLDLFKSLTHVGNEQLAVLNCLPVDKRVDFITLCHVKMHNNSSPSYMQEHCIPVSSSHQYSTRFSVTTTNNSNNSDNGFKDSVRYTILRVKGFGKKSFVFRGCLLWNELPQHIRDSEPLVAFKHNAKHHLLL